MDKNSQLIGKLIRDLRKQQNITGSELGYRVNMSQSKVSKLENGLYWNLRFKEIERILNILNAPHATRQRIYRLIESVKPSELQYLPYDVQFTKVRYKDNLKTTLTRVFSPYNVPALLQTNEYRLALLKGLGAPEDDAEILKFSAQRQELLWDTKRQFHFIMHQAALYNAPPGQKRLSLEQIDRLERFMGLPNIKIGFVPLEAGMPAVEFGPFALLDERLLATGTIEGDMHSANSKAIALHGRIFAELSQRAVYGEEAKQLIQASIKYFG